MSEVLAKVLERDPDFKVLPVGTPLALGRLLRRCLEKDRKHRLQHIGDARLEIDEPREKHVSGVAEPTADTSPQRAIQARHITAAVIAVCAAGVLGYYLRSPSLAPASSMVPRLVNAVQVTSALGVEYPALSPDGEWLAYSSEESGNPDIWVLQLGSGQAVNRTVDNPGSDTWPRWSPDGRQIAFNSAEGDGRSVWAMTQIQLSVICSLISWIVQMLG